MVWKPIPDQHTNILTHRQTHGQTEFYNIRLSGLKLSEHVIKVTSDIFLETIRAADLCRGVSEDFEHQVRRSRDEHCNER